MYTKPWTPMRFWQSQKGTPLDFSEASWFTVASCLTEVSKDPRVRFMGICLWGCCSVSLLHEHVPTTRHPIFLRLWSFCCFYPSAFGCFARYNAAVLKNIQNIQMGFIVTCTQLPRFAGTSSSFASTATAKIARSSQMIPDTTRRIHHENEFIMKTPGSFLALGVDQRCL